MLCLENGQAEDCLRFRVSIIYFFSLSLYRSKELVYLSVIELHRKTTFLGKISITATMLGSLSLIGHTVLNILSTDSKVRTTLYRIRQVRSTFN